MVYYFQSKPLIVKPDRASGLVEIHVAALLFGLAGLFAKFLPLPAWCIVLGRTGFATMALAAALVFSKHGRYPQGGKTIALLCLLGVILAIHWITFFHAIQVSSVAVGLLAFSTFPVFITCLEPFWFNEKRRMIDWMTAFMVLAGLGIMVYPSGFRGQVFSGVAWGTLAGFTFAILSLLNRKWVRDYPPVVITLYQNAVAALVLLPMLAVVDLRVNARQIGLLIFLGVICTALSHALFIRGLRFVRAQLASVIACLEPVYGIAFAFFLLHEVPSTTTLTGGAIIVVTTVAATCRRASV